MEEELNGQVTATYTAYIDATRKLPGPTCRIYGRKAVA